MYFLASPYTDIDLNVEANRYALAVKALINFTKEGITVFSPIVHSHMQAVFGKLPRSSQFWTKINSEFIELSEGVIVLELDGWMYSNGIRNEIELATKLNKPVIYCKGITENYIKQFVKDMPMLIRTYNNV